MKWKNEKRKASIAMIVGSPNPTSRLNGLTVYIEKKLLSTGAIHIQFIRVVELPPEDLIYKKFESPNVHRAHAKIEEADAIIVASPVYKASYTGVLKTYLDLLPKQAFEGKLVFPLFIGGTISHLLSLDYALKPLLAALGARHIL